MAGSSWIKRGMRGLRARPSDRATTRHHGDLSALPPGTDWHWQPAFLRSALQPDAAVTPEPGSRFGDEIGLWHDCASRAATLRQIQNDDRPDQPPFRLMVEMADFSGSYLSLSLDLPADVLDRLDHRHHILRLDMSMQAERAITIYARLNLLQGPNTETILRQMGDPIEGENAERRVGFDLTYADLSARPIDKIWLDLILESPGTNAVTIRDLVLSRYPRASV